LADETPTNGETPEVTPAGETPAPSNTDGETPEETFDPDRAKALIAKLRQEAKDAKRLQKELDTIKGRDLSETERLKQELAARDEELSSYRTRERERTAEAEVTKASAGAIKTEAIWRIVRHDIEYDDDGQPTNVKRLVEATKREMPELFRSPNGSADGGAGQLGLSAQPNMNDLIREMAREAR
jgi:hypothetical protein